MGNELFRLYDSALYDFKRIRCISRPAGIACDYVNIFEIQIIRFNCEASAGLCRCKNKTFPPAPAHSIPSTIASARCLARPQPHPPLCRLKFLRASVRLSFETSITSSAPGFLCLLKPELNHVSADDSARVICLARRTFNCPMIPNPITKGCILSSYADSFQSFNNTCGWLYQCAVFVAQGIKEGSEYHFQD